MQLWLTLLGAFLATAGGFWEKAYARTKERQSLRSALRAEISAILAIVERRNYIATLAATVENIRSGATGFFQGRINRDYDIVFRSNCGKLGLLPSDLARRIVSFHYLVGSAIEDLLLLSDAAESPNLQSRYHLDTQEGSVRFHEELLAISRQAILLGNELTNELESKAAATQRLQNW